MGTRFRSLAVVLLTAAGIAATVDAQEPAAAPATFAAWTWMSGANTPGGNPVYGTKGVAAAANIPGARREACSFQDDNGNFWVFGGWGRDKFGSEGYLNDLWKFNGQSWTWVSGADIINRFGVTGTKGVTAPTNMPGSRRRATGWTDAAGHFWILGGEGFGPTGLAAGLNDLWKFDGTNWTWVGGSDAIAQGIYVAKGVASPVNYPGTRQASTGWTDAAGNLWMFGGFGYDLGGHSGFMSELWKYDGANWSWVSGNFNSNNPGVYGTQGVRDPANEPGGRQDATAWVDNAGNFYVFGGYGYDALGAQGARNGLGRFDGFAWTWIAGSATTNAAGVYGLKGTADAANDPGARSAALAWVEASGLAYVFGGSGFDVNNSQGNLNDLWAFDGKNWAWISGSNTIHAPGVYGTKGTANPANVPGSRSSGLAWRDGPGNLWLFGGVANTSYGTILNDLWRCKPAASPTAKPPAPTGLAAHAGNGGVGLTWNGSIGAQTYTVNRGTKAGQESAYATGVKQLFYIDRNAANGTKYYYTVSAVGPTGKSQPSNEVSATPLSALPAAPTLTATGGNSQVALSWNATGTSYQVYRSAFDGGPFAPLGGVITTTTYTDTTAANETTYYYGVVAKNAVGWGIPSNQASATPHAPVSAVWTWENGATVGNQAGVYGTKGVPSPLNVPGSRTGSATWTDAQGRFWMFSGSIFDPNYFLPGTSNDLWRYDGTNWTWVGGGGTLGDVVGVYGTKGVANAANTPGARTYAATWTDNAGNLWLFGGNGYDGGGSSGMLNDLWKFNGTTWTWVAGSDTAASATGVYGTKGVANAANTPGGRQISAYAKDGAGNLWLFGGENSNGYFNDLWKFNGTQWTWISGSNVINTEGVWGTKGVAAATNVVNNRSGAALWIDSSNCFWLFGGYGRFQGSQDEFNDLWKFDGTTWTWVAGTDLLAQPSVMGVKGVADPANTPGARAQGTRWIDVAGHLWYFGGIGHDGSNGLGSCNDLWMFDGTAWTWMSGASTVYQVGNYGTKGVAAPTNVPGARSGAPSFVDVTGAFWLFGGIGSDSTGAFTRMNDLWRYGP
jgi:N-acetylneuraminic acid mutarotase